MDEKVERDEKGGRPAVQPGQTTDSFEQRKKEASIVLLDEVLRFVKIDNDINEQARDLFGTIVSEIKKNPTAAFAGNLNVDKLVANLKSKEGPGTSGGDIVGAFDFGDVIDLIDKLGGGQLLKDEKEFFLTIIKLVFCGC